MKDLRSKKAIAASLSLTLALGSVPAVALADNADENGEGTTSEQSSQAEFVFSANGGQFADGSISASVMGNEGGSVDAPTPTYAGYTFKGWYSLSNMDGIPEDYQQYYRLDLSSAKAGSWFAAWEKNADVQAEQVTVKFVDNFNETESSVEVKKGEAVAKPADPTYDGWTFEGWSSTLKDDEGNWEYTPVDFSKAVEDEDQDGVVTYYAFYSEDQAAADNTANGEEAAGQEAAGDDANAADESSIAPQTGDATNVAAVAGIGGIAGLLAAAAALLRRRRNN